MSLKSNSFIAVAEEVCLQPVLEHRQRRGRRNIAWQAIPHRSQRGGGVHPPFGDKHSSRVTVICGIRGLQGIAIYWLVFLIFSIFLRVVF